MAKTKVRRKRTSTTGYVAGSPKGGKRGTVRPVGTPAPVTDTPARAKRRGERRRGEAPPITPSTPKVPFAPTPTGRAAQEREERRRVRRKRSQVRRKRAVATVQRRRERREEPDFKPKRYEGHPTAGTPTNRELRRAEASDKLKVNRKGFLTTPKVRQAGGELKQARKAAAKQGPRIEGVVHGEEAERFAKRLAQRTGIAPEAVGAWVNAEGGGTSAGGEAGKNNWLGVGYPGEQTPFSQSPAFNGTPEQAADATADWMEGKIGGEYDYAAAQGIKEIIPKARGKGADAFLQALKDSGWGTSVSHVADGIGAISARPGNPKAAKRLRRARKVARKAGLKVQPKGSGGAKKLPGPFDGSRAMVRKIVGAKVFGDKEPGHSSTGDHDPSQPNAYAQDINMPGGNAGEGEPGFTQGTLTKMVKNLRKLGADVPDLQLGQDNWEGTVDGYKVQVLTIEHGSGPHIHVGARWSGESTSAGYSEGGGGGVSYSTDQVAAYAEATGQSVEKVRRRLEKGKLTGRQILTKLNALGAGVGPDAEVETEPAGEEPNSVLDALERKYEVGAV